MATLSKPVGYECEFVDQVPEDYLCKQCKHVAREPTIASCCIEVLCKACVDAVIQDKKPCPSCRETDFSYMPHKKYQPKILALKVHCLMKDHGCEWIGQLQHLDSHLDATSGDCVYVDVDCPSECNQKVQKRNVKTHLENECPNRDYICPHCSFRATFREVSQHFEVCRYYPLMCPNRCGVTFERDEVEDHMKMCSLQKVQCEFSYAGCQAEFIRNKQKEHMEQNTQKHLALMAAATLRISQEQQQTFDQKLQEQQKMLERKFQEKDAQIKVLEEQQEALRAQQQDKLQKQQQAFEQKLQEKDAQIKVLEEEQQKKLGEQQKEFHKQLEENAQQIKRLEEQHGSSINSLHMAVGIPPCDITVSDFQKVKARDGCIESLPMYTHPGGCRFMLKLWPNGRISIRQMLGRRHSHDHVSVGFYSVAGEHDDSLKLPVQFTIAIELINQHRDQDHYTRDIQCEVTREKIGQLSRIGSDYNFIPHTGLQWNADEQTLYLKNDTLRFRITKIVMQ